LLTNNEPSDDSETSAHENSPNSDPQGGRAQVAGTLGEAVHAVLEVTVVGRMTPPAMSPVTTADDWRNVGMADALIRAIPMISVRPPKMRVNTPSPPPSSPLRVTVPTRGAVAVSQGRKDPTIMNSPRGLPWPRRLGRYLPATAWR
jgi:hypothetical protein